MTCAQRAHWWPPGRSARRPAAGGRRRPDRSRGGSLGCRSHSEVVVDHQLEGLAQAIAIRCFHGDPHQGSLPEGVGEWAESDAGMRLKPAIRLNHHQWPWLSGVDIGAGHGHHRSAAQNVCCRRDFFNSSRAERCLSLSPQPMRHCSPLAHKELSRLGWLRKFCRVAASAATRPSVATVHSA